MLQRLASDFRVELALDLNISKHMDDRNDAKCYRQMLRPQDDLLKFCHL